MTDYRNIRVLFSAGDNWYPAIIGSKAVVVLSDNIGCVGCDIKHCPFTLSYRKPVHRGYAVNLGIYAVNLQ